MTLIKYIHWVTLHLNYATIFTILIKRICDYIFRKLQKNTLNLEFENRFFVRSVELI